MGNKNGAGLSDISVAVVQIADSLDRAVYVLERLAIGMDLVHPDEVGPSRHVAALVDAQDKAAG